MELSIIARRIKSARIERGMSQTDLAIAAGVAPGQVNRYEAGGNIPRAHMVKKLATALEVSFEWLNGKTEDLMSGDVSEKRSYPSDDADKVLVRLTGAEMKDQLKSLSKEAGRTMNAEINIAILDHIHRAIHPQNNQQVPELSERALDRLADLLLEKFFARMTTRN